MVWLGIGVWINQTNRAVPCWFYASLNFDYEHIFTIKIYNLLRRVITLFVLSVLFFIIRKYINRGNIIHNNQYSPE